MFKFLFFFKRKKRETKKEENKMFPFFLFFVFLFVQPHSWTGTVFQKEEKIIRIAKIVYTDKECNHSRSISYHDFHIKTYPDPILITNTEEYCKRSPIGYRKMKCSYVEEDEIILTFVCNEHQQPIIQNATIGKCYESPVRSNYFWRFVPRITQIINNEVYYEDIKPEWKKWKTNGLPVVLASNLW